MSPASFQVEVGGQTAEQLMVLGFEGIEPMSSFPRTASCSTATLRSCTRPSRTVQPCPSTCGPAACRMRSLPSRWSGCSGRHQGSRRQGQKGPWW